MSSSEMAWSRSLLLARGRDGWRAEFSGIAAQWRSPGRWMLPAYVLRQLPGLPPAGHCG